MDDPRPNGLNLALEVDIDLRMRRVWELAAESGIEIGPDVARVLRLAFVDGYWHALSEPEIASLCVEHGYAVPKRQGMPSLAPPVG